MSKVYVVNFAGHDHVNPDRLHIKPKGLFEVLCGDRTVMLKTSDMTSEQADSLPPGTCVGCKGKWKVMVVAK